MRSTRYVGRHEIRPVLLHQCDRFVVQHRAVLDRRHARAHGGLDALGAVRMRRDLHAVPRGFVDHRLQLLVGVLLRADRSLERQHARRRAGLDDLGAVLDLVAHRLDHLPRAVGDALLGTPCSRTPGANPVTSQCPPVMPSALRDGTTRGPTTSSASTALPSATVTSPPKSRTVVKPAISKT